MSGRAKPCEAKLESISGQLEVIRRKVEGLTRIVTDGADREYPWFRLNQARRKSVEAVLNFLRDHRSYTIRKASAKVFVKSPGGYPNWESLAAYCYAVDIATYL